MNFNIELYEQIIKLYQQAGYDFIDFHGELNPQNKIILRHDIDFDVKKSLEIAHLENKLEVIATYFFLLRSDSYNFCEESNLQAIKEIAALGHEVSIHFDPTLYSDLENGMKFEIQLFRLLTGLEPKIVSFHRPSQFFLDHDDPFFGLPHTYQDKFFKDIKYIADSAGGFFYDDPIDCQAFKNRDSIQFLTHPIWWTTPGKTNIEKIKNYLSANGGEFSKHFAKNCKPWKKYLADKYLADNQSTESTI